MKLKARILLFDKVNSSGDMFPKDCKLAIPDKFLCYGILNKVNLHVVSPK